MPDNNNINSPKPSGVNLSGLGGIISGLDSFLGISANRQLKHQQRLMQQQQSYWKQQQQILNDYQLEQWNRENEYNDPTNYYDRLFNAADVHGINKNVLLGGVSGNVGQSATGVRVPGSTSVPGVGGVSQQSIGAGMSVLMQGMRQRAEIENIQSQTDKNRADAGLSLEKTESESVLRSYLGALTTTQEFTQKLLHEQTLTEGVERSLKDMQRLCVSAEKQMLDFNLRYNKTFAFSRANAELSKIYQDMSESLSRMEQHGFQNKHYLAMIGALKIQGALNEEITRGHRLENNFLSATFTNRIIQATENALQSQLTTKLMNKDNQTYFARFAFSSFESLTRSAGNIFQMFNDYSRTSFDQDVKRRGDKNDSTTQYIDKNGELLFTIAKYGAKYLK